MSSQTTETNSIGNPFKPGTAAYANYQKVVGGEVATVGNHTLAYWAIELKDGTIGLVQSATKPKTQNAVMITGGLTADSVGTAVNKLPNAGRILAGYGRGGESLLATNGAPAIASVQKTGTGLIYNAKDGKAAALAALGVFATGFAALGGAAVAGAAGAGEEDAAAGAAGGAGGTAAKDAGTVAKDATKAATSATLLGLLVGIGPVRILEAVAGLILIVLGVRSFITIASGGSGTTINLQTASKLARAA